MKIPSSGDWLLSVFLFGPCQCLILPPLSLYFKLCLHKLTSLVLVHCNTSKEHRLTVRSCQEWISLPSPCPKVFAFVNQTKRWQYPPVLMLCLLDFQLGNVCISPRCILEGWPPGWGAMFSSPLHLCATRGQHLSEEFLLFALFFCIFLLCLCSVWQDNSESIVKAVSGLNFWDMIFTVFSSV